LIKLFFQKEKFGYTKAVMCPESSFCEKAFRVGQIIETLELIWFAGALEEFRDRIIYIPF